MPTEPQPLTEEALKEIEARRYKAVRSYHSGDDVNWFLTVGVPALCQSLRAVRADVAEWELHRDGIIEAVKTAEARVNELKAENAALREQLAQVEKERFVLTEEEFRLLADHHYLAAERAITRRGDQAGQRQHLERLAVIRLTKERP